MAEPLLEGLPARTALWQILVHRGVMTSRQMLDEESNFSLEMLLQKLRAHGFEARCVKIHIKDLMYMQLPTLLLTHEDNWILLRKRTIKGWLVEYAGGQRLVSETTLERSFSGVALDISNAFPADGGLWMRLLRLLPEHRKLLLMTLGASVLAQGLALISPLLTTWMIDGALTKGVGSLLQILCIGLVLTAFFKAWTGWLRDITLNAFSARIDVALEKGLFDHLLHLPFSHLQGKTLGELLQAFSGVRRARALVLNRGLAAIFDAFTAVALLAYMMILMPAVAGLVVLGAFLLSAISIFNGIFQAREMRLRIMASQAQRSALVELLNGALTLKATGSQTWVLERWKNKLGVELTHALRQDRISLWSDATSEFLSHGSSVCILIWGGFRVLAGEISLGQLLAFSQLSGLFVGVVTNLSQTMLAVITAKPLMAEVHETFSIASSPRMSSLYFPKLTSPVIAENVWFRYEEHGPWILEGTHLKVQPDTFHHLKGASGSGKSTLLKLLAGLYSPDIGRISLGGLDSRAAANSMILLPQFPELFTGSILENLCNFSGERSKLHIFKVAEETGLNEWIETLPMGYQTMVACGGGNFSGGQRQLIAITAILASNRQLLLLDEALSNLDWVSRQRIIQSPRFQGRTVIYASHEEILTGKVDH